MQGIGKIKNLKPEQRQSPKNVFIYSKDKFEPLIVGKTQSSLRKGELGPEIGFSQSISKKHPVYMIKFAASGQPLHPGWNGNKWLGGEPNPNRVNFYPGKNKTDPNKGRLYKSMIARYQAGIKAITNQGDTPVIKGFLWMQGEQDSKNETSATTYAAHLKLLRDRVAQDLNIKKLPFVYGQVLPYKKSLPRFTHRKEIRDQMAAADKDSGKPEAISFAKMVCTDTFPLLKDTVHYNAQGQWMLGTEMANQLTTMQPMNKNVSLWKGQVPGFSADFEHKPFTQQDPQRITNTSHPFMRVFPATVKPTGQAMVILPGGGYRILSDKKEGEDVARYYAAQGITCFVACYRVTKGNNPGYQFPGPLLDARQAIKMAKESAQTYGFNPDQVGVMGFSAGGHLASMCGTLYDKTFPGELESKFSPKPAFVALIYPVASMIAPSSHKGSKRALIGAKPTEELIRLTSPELNIPKDAPPLFIAHNHGDPVDAKLSEVLAKGWQKSGREVEINLFEGRDHGFGMGRPGQTKETHPAIVWPDLLLKFLSSKATPTSAAPKVDIPQHKGWKLVWHDEFSDAKLNDTFWSRCKRGKSDWNNTMSPREDLLDIKDGILSLKAIQNPDRSKDKSPYLTAGLLSKGKYSFTYGKVQVRAKLQGAKGAWPAIWMLGEQGKYPVNGEIDLMERLNFEDQAYQTLHSVYTKRDKTGTPKKSKRSAIDPEGWNTYGCEWDADKIVLTINNKPTHTYPRVPKLGKDQWPFDKPFYFLLTMQVGGGWVNGKGPTNAEHYPADMKIDWIRVYQKK